MVRSCLLASIWVAIGISQPLLAENYLRLATTDGGSVTTNLGYGIALNKNSSLHRQWFVINDTSCPISLGDAGVSTSFHDRDYMYKAAGTISAQEPIAAFEVRFMLFDVWGDHMKTLSGTELRDIPEATPFSLSEIGSWRAWENDATQYLTSVAYIAHVRTSDGRAWSYDSKALLRELDTVKLSLTQEQLEPDKRKE